MNRIPKNKQWVSSGQSDTLGSLWSSFNLDLTSTPLTTKVSPRTFITTDGITGLGTPVAFLTFTDQNAGAQYLWTVAGTRVFRAPVTNGYIGEFAFDTSTGTTSGTGAGATSSNTSDLVGIGKDNMVLSLDARMYVYNASTGQWFNVAYKPGESYVAVTLTGGAPHPLCIHQGRVYVVDESVTIRSVALNNFISDLTAINLTTSGANFIDLSDKGYPITIITKILSSNAGIWIFTLNQSYGGNVAFLWDGVDSNAPQQRYIIQDSSGILAAVLKDDIPWVIDNQARLLYFNGGTFVEAPNGQLPVKNYKLLKNGLSGVNDRWIHPNGIQIDNNRINILINNEYEDYGGTAEENIASGIWEYDENIGWYHKKSLSITTDGSTDFGQHRVSRVGALYIAEHGKKTSSANGSMLIGADVFTDATNTKSVILTDDTKDIIQKYGYLITPKIYSPNIQEDWDSLYARYKPLLNATDKIIVKCRTEEVEPIENTITWTNAGDVFLITQSGLSVGDEVEYTQGVGGGFTTHIKAIEDAGGGNYYITTTEAITGATNGLTGKARFSNWKIIDTTSQLNKNYHRFKAGKKSTWIQFKVCFLFTGNNEIDDFILTNNKLE